MNSKGFSTLEVMVGSVVVGILALAAFYFTTVLRSQTSPTTQLGLRCDSVNRSILDQVISNAGAAKRHTPNPSLWANTPAEVLFPTDAADPTYTLVTNSVLWSGVPPYLASSGGRWEVSLSPSTSGLARVLESWYNTGPAAICSGDYAGVAEINAFAHEITAALQPRIGFNGSQVSLQLFDLNTGATIPGCNRPVWLAPRGARPGNANFDAYSAGYALNVGRPVTVRDDVGLRLTLRTHLIQEGQQQTCDLVHDVSLEGDTNAPARPNIALTAISYPTASGATANQNALTMDIRYPASGKKGVIMLCRDRSTLMPTGGYQCFSPGGTVGVGPGPQIHWDGRADDRIVGLPAWNETLANQHGASRPGAWGTPGWVRCQDVTVCNRAPATTTPIFSASTGEFGTFNTYQNVRSNCIVRVEAAAVDAAGNLDFDGGTYHPRQIQSSTYLAGETQTPRPACDTPCPINYLLPIAPGNVYLQTGSCCSGLGCTTGQVGSPSGPIMTESFDLPL